MALLPSVRALRVAIAAASLLSASIVVSTLVSTGNQTAQTTTGQPVVTRFSGTMTAPETAEPAQKLVYIVKMKNEGTVNTSARLAAFAPANTTYQPQWSTPGCTQQGTFIYCNYVGFSPGQEISLTLYFMVDQAAPTGAVIENMGSFQVNGLTVDKTNIVKTKIGYPAQCGNGVLEGAELCDDGNTTMGDGCTSDCRKNPYFTCAVPGQLCVATCGDGRKIAGLEMCDDANKTSGDGCSLACQIETNYQCQEASPEAKSVCTPKSVEVCGDGKASANEMCDDGNKDSGDGCSSACNMEPGFTCSAGKIGERTVCSLYKPSVCGNGKVELGEVCDDGNTATGDGCWSDCKAKNPDANCVEGKPCTWKCGVGKYYGGSQGTCDDGNQTSGDGCSNACQIESGFSCTQKILEKSVCAPTLSSAECNDGKDNDGDSRIDLKDPGCANAQDQKEADGPADFEIALSPTKFEPQRGTTTMLLVQPGNRGPDSAAGDITVYVTAPAGVKLDLNALGERCTADGNNVRCRFRSYELPDNSNYIAANPVYYVEQSAACGIPLTFGAKIESLKQSDPGQRKNDTSVSITVPCTSTCGNGKLEGAEKCDDGNAAAGDGCLGCQIDPGFTCTGTPSVCQNPCGDGLKRGKEQCDDANKTPGDGCNASCEVESNYQCKEASPKDKSVCTPTGGLQMCGNAKVEKGEQCDTGTQRNGTCSNKCTICPIADCAAPPAGCRYESDNTVGPDGCFANLCGKLVCAAVCGNAKLETGEQCDDGNTEDRDGCSATCRLEQSSTDADMQVQYAIMPETIAYAEPYEARFTVLNNGPAAAKNVRVIMLMPHEKARFVADQSDPNCSLAEQNRAILCNLHPSLASGVGSTHVVTFDTSDIPCSSSAVQLWEKMAVGSETPDRRSENNLAYNSTGSKMLCPVGLQSGLSIAIKGSVTTDTAVKNQKDVTLLRFEARTEDRSVQFNPTIFQATRGTLFNAVNYRMWVDTDGDGNVDSSFSNGTAMGNRLTFADPSEGGYSIAPNTTVVFEVHADIASSLSANTLAGQVAPIADPLLQIGFAKYVDGFISAEYVPNGEALAGITYDGELLFGATSASIAVSSANATVTTFRLLSQGDLFVTKDTTPVRSRQLLGGTLGDTILQLQMRAQNEAIVVTDLQILSGDSGALNVDRLELYKVGATVSFASATTGGCGSDSVPQGAYAFCANMESNQLVIPEGDRMLILVKPRMKSDQEGAQPGRKLSLLVHEHPEINETLGIGAVRARGLVSSNALAGNDGDALSEGEVFIGTDIAAPNARITGNIHDIVFAKLATLTNFDFNAEGTTIPAGRSVIARYSFMGQQNVNTLNGLNAWTLDAIIFNIASTGVAFDATGFKLINEAYPSVAHPCVTLSSNGALISGSFAEGNLFVVCDNLKSQPIVTELPSNSNVSYVLVANIVDPATSIYGSSMQVTLQNFSNIAQTAFGWDKSHIKWFDEDTTQTVFRWVELGNTVIRGPVYRR